MQIQIAGKHINIGDALRSHIETGLEASVRKYFDRPVDGAVTVSKEGHSFVVECSIHLTSGMGLQSHGEADNAHAAVEASLDKLEKRLRRYKRRLKNHHKTPVETEVASSFVLRPLDDDADMDDEPVEDGGQGLPIIVAETRVDVRTLTVSMAVMQLEMSEAPAIMFRNAAHGGLNMVFWRKDGNIGWIDPTRSNPD